MAAYGKEKILDNAPRELEKGKYEKKRGERIKTEKGLTRKEEEKERRWV